MVELDGGSTVTKAHAQPEFGAAICSPLPSGGDGGSLDVVFSGECAPE
jgi:hypothetical protein